MFGQSLHQPAPCRRRPIPRLPLVNSTIQPIRQQFLSQSAQPSRLCAPLDRLGSTGLWRRGLIRPARRRQQEPDFRPPRLSCMNSKGQAFRCAIRSHRPCRPDRMSGLKTWIPVQACGTNSMIAQARCSIPVALTICSIRAPTSRHAALHQPRLP